MRKRRSEWVTERIRCEFWSALMKYGEETERESEGYSCFSSDVSEGEGGRDDKDDDDDEGVREVRLVTRGDACGVEREEVEV